MYERDLAHIHDDGFGWLARGAAPGIARRLEAAGIDAGLVVDLGCGSGILARALTDAGYDVLGVDQSAALLHIARKRVPEARFVQGSLHDVELPTCRAITAVGEIFGYAGAGGGLFERLHDALEPGGLLLFDIAAPGREANEPRRAWHEGDGWLLCMEAWADGATLTRSIITFTHTSDGRWRRSDETHRLTLHEPAEVVAALRGAGFGEARVADAGYGPELELPSGLVVIEARR
jgi:SAM-dependent methyltransferase